MPTTTSRGTLIIDPEPQFLLSPHRFTQFMEPLGTVDGSVDAAWDYLADSWREDVTEITRKLAPGLIRWGGILTSYYRWKEGVGPREDRISMLNLCWGGIESNQVGTHEFVDFCRRVGADPLIGINLESDGQRKWSHPPKGGVRSAGADEAAEWVDYCNSPSNVSRIQNGAPEPFDVRLWQLGNETSYGRGGFDCETAAEKTLAFAQAMRQADPTIELIGWGDSGWAPRMLDIAGEELDYIAFHHHFNSGLDDSPLQWNEYRTDPANTWRHLMNAYQSTEAKIQAMREQTAGYDVSFALTESHFGLPGRNRCDVLSTWAAGVACARILNVHERNGDILKIATLADFCGTRWQNNAIMIPTPKGHFEAYMMPVAKMMSLYRHHSGEMEVSVTSAPKPLDVTASRTGEQLFLHVVNTSMSEALRVELRIEGMSILSGCAFEVVDDPMQEIDQHAPDLFLPREFALPLDATWLFPAASVTVIELTVENETTDQRTHNPC